MQRRCRQNIHISRALVSSGSGSTAFQRTDCRSRQTTSDPARTSTLHSCRVGARNTRAISDVADATATGPASRRRLRSPANFERDSWGKWQLRRGTGRGLNLRHPTAGEVQDWAASALPVPPVDHAWPCTRTNSNVLGGCLRAVTACGTLRPLFTAPMYLCFPRGGR